MLEGGFKEFAQSLKSVSPLKVSLVFHGPKFSETYK